MDIRNICIGCMCEIKNRSQATFCPSCGYDFRNMKSLPHQLQPYTVLKEKYLIGKVLGQGGFGITYIGNAGCN